MKTNLLKQKSWMRNVIYKRPPLLKPVISVRLLCGSFSWTAGGHLHVVIPVSDFFRLKQVAPFSSEQPYFELHL